jgi:hypothetical protein
MKDSATLGQRQELAVATLCRITDQGSAAGDFFAGGNVCQRRYQGTL